MITLDTSGLFAYVNRTDPYHEQVAQILEEDPAPWIIPTGILAEITYLLETRGGPAPLRSVLLDIEDGVYQQDCGEGDIPRILQIIDRYADLRLGYADASVIACAERHGGRTVTTDRRHFPVVARGEGTITVLPT